MPGILVRLIDSKKGDFGVQVSHRGQLVVAPIEFSEAHPATLDTINVGFNLAPPITGQCFIITNLLLDAGKDVSPTTAGTVVIYEADSVDTATVFKEILTIEMLRNTNRIIGSLNLLVNQGKWLNIKTTDATVNATALGYYVIA